MVAKYGYPFWYFFLDYIIAYPSGDPVLCCFRSLIEVLGTLLGGRYQISRMVGSFSNYALQETPSRLLIVVKISLKQYSPSQRWLCLPSGCKSCGKKSFTRVYSYAM